MKRRNGMSGNEMLKGIVNKIRGNIARDVAMGTSCEQAAGFQFVQLRKAGVAERLANEIVKMAIS